MIRAIFAEQVIFRRFPRIQSLTLVMGRLKNKKAMPKNLWAGGR